MNIKISQLPAAVSLNGNEAVPISVGGETRRTTVQAIADLAGASVTVDTTIVDGSTNAVSGNAVFDALALKANVLQAINTQTASYTLVLADNGKKVRMNVASANVLTVPLNASVAFAIGTTVWGRVVGAGSTTITPIGGVTINGSTLEVAQYGDFVLHKVGTNEWDLSAGGAGSSLIQLSAPGSITTGTPTATTIPFTFGAVTGESSFVFEITTAADTSFAAIVQTLTPAADATSGTFTGLTASTGYIYRGRSIGDGVTYSTSANSSTVSVTTAAAGAAWVPYILDVQGNYSRTGTVYAPTSSPGALSSTLKVAQGTAGSYRLKRVAVDFKDAVIGFDVDNTLEGYAGHICNVYCQAADGSFTALIGGGNAAGTIPLSGYLEFDVSTSGVITAFTNDGTTRTACGTVGTISGSDIYLKIQANLNPANDSHIYNPEGINLV